MTEHKNKIEEMLLKFRPASPPEGLRGRVLSAADSSGGSGRAWGLWVFRAAIAAMLVIALGLNVAANKMTKRLIASIGGSPAAWTKESEEAAKMLDGNGWARQYMITRSSPGLFPPKAPAHREN